jgi:hypothetical protein
MMPSSIISVVVLPAPFDEHVEIDDGPHLAERLGQASGFDGVQASPPPTFTVIPEGGLRSRGTLVKEWIEVVSHLVGLADRPGTEVEPKCSTAAPIHRVPR